MTIEETNRMIERLKAEEEYRFEDPLCGIHEKIVKSCADCKKLKTEGSLKDEELTNKYLEGLIALPDEDNPEKFIIQSTYSYLDENPDIGKLQHSMLEESLKSTKLMYERAAKRPDVLKEIDKHYVKMINNRAVRLVTSDEVDKIASGELKCQFICRSWVEKPSSGSTKVRVIADTARSAPGLGVTLAETMRCPKKALNSLLHAQLLFHLHEFHYEGDVKAAYYQIKVTQEISFLALSFWFYDVINKGTSEPLMLAALAQEFGWGNAGLKLRLGIKKFPATELEGFLQYLVLKVAYVDNFPVMSPTGDKLEGRLMVNKLKQVFAKYSIDLDKVIASHNTDENVASSGVTEHNGYGLTWFLKTDEVRNLIKLSPYKTVKGRETGPRLEDKPLDWRTLTRRQIARLTSQLYCATGRSLEILKMSAKLTLSLVCEVMPPGKIDEKISDYSEDIAKKAAGYFNSIKDYQKMKPLRRYCLKAGFEIKYFVISHDGSEYGNSSCLHLVSQKKQENKVDDEEKESLILTANSAVGKKSFENETKSFGRAMELLIDVVEAYENILNEETEFIITGDNRPATFALSDNVQRTTLSRNVKLLIHKTLEKISTTHPKYKFYFTWMDTFCHPSDRCSKFQSDPIKEQESRFWRNGPAIYKNEKIMKKFTFMTYWNKEKIFTELPEYLRKDVTIPEAIALWTLQSSRLISSLKTHCPAQAQKIFFLEEGEDLRSRREKSFYRGMSVQAKPHSPPSPDTTEQELETELVNEYQVMLTSRRLTAGKPDGEEAARLLALDQEHAVSLHNMMVTTRAQKRLALDNASEPVPETPPPTPPPPPESPPESPRRPETTPGAAAWRPPSAAERDSMVMDMRSITGMTHNESLPPVVDMSVAESPRHEFSRELYEDLMKRKNDLPLLTRIWACCLKAVNRMKNKKILTNKEAVTQSLSMIIMADQCFWPIPLARKDIVRTAQGFLTVKRNVEVGPEVNMFSTNQPPILHGNSPVMVKILRLAHVDKNEFGFGRDRHHISKTTRVRVNTGAFPGTCLRLGETIKNFICSCSGCLRSELKYYRVKMNKTYTKSQNCKLFKRVSFDPLGFVETRAWKGAKKKMKVYPMLFKCLDSGVIELGIAEGLDQTSMISALRRMCYNLGVSPEVVTHDAQPSLTVNNLSPKIEEGRLWGNTRFVRHLAKAQRRNYCESSTNLVKQIWARILRKSKGELSEDLDKLTVLELLMLLNYITITANVTPFSEDSSFSPAHLRYGLRFLICDIPAPQEGLKDCSEHFKNLEGTLKEYTDIVDTERNVMMCEHEARFREKYHSDGNRLTKTNFDAQVHDVVIIKDENTPAKLGLIVKIKPGGTTATVRAGGKNIVRMLASLHPIVSARNGFAEEKRELEEGGELKFLCKPTIAMYDESGFFKFKTRKFNYSLHLNFEKFLETIFVRIWTTRFIFTRFSKFRF